MRPRQPNLCLPILYVLVWNKTGSNIPAALVERCLSIAITLRQKLPNPSYHSQVKAVCPLAWMWSRKSRSTVARARQQRVWARVSRQHMLSISIVPRSRAMVCRLLQVHHSKLHYPLRSRGQKMYQTVLQLRLETGKPKSRFKVTRCFASGTSTLGKAPKPTTTTKRDLSVCHIRCSRTHRIWCPQGNPTIKHSNNNNSQATFTLISSSSCSSDSKCSSSSSSSTCNSSSSSSSSSSSNSLLGRAHQKRVSLSFNKNNNLKSKAQSKTALTQINKSSRLLTTSSNSKPPPLAKLTSILVGKVAMQELRQLNKEFSTSTSRDRLRRKCR